MKIVILSEEIGVQDSPDVSDTLTQVRFVQEQLISLGHQAISMTFHTDLARTIREIQTIRPDVIFNLVESVAGFGRLSVIATYVYQALGIPFTGNRDLAHLLSADKVLAKRFYQTHGILTPAGFTLNDMPEEISLGVPYILKAAGEHASIGLSSASVITPASRDELTEALTTVGRKHDLTFLAEEYIDGREFNVGFLGRRMLPVVEMFFTDSFKCPRILTYEAKWNDNTAAAQNSVRKTDIDPRLTQKMETFCTHTADVLDIHGYTRFDFRLDAAEENFYLIDLNTNPCLSPDAGFVAMARLAGLEPRDIVERILHDIVV